MAVVAGTWSLVRSTNEAAESSFGLDEEGDESLFGDDNRSLVDPQHFAPGGKYRSIVKLFMRYEGQAAGDGRYAMGTGWLIRPDLLVTAGHCAYDWSQNGGRGFGRATEVKAYIGYNGKDSIKSNTVQFRTGAKIVTTEGWLKSSENRQNDVSFIKLDRPFEGIVPLKFTTTPEKGNEFLGVVGYPGDKRLDGTTGEQGAQMYEEFQNVKWNLNTSATHMLEYRINTYKGQSGSPVLRQNQISVSIGAHVYGGAGNNSASSIAGAFGNPYSAYISVFDKRLPITTTKAGIDFIQVGGFTPSESISDDDDEEGFWSKLKDVVKIGMPIVGGALKVASPFLGPIGGPISALAGVAIGAAGKKLAESGFEDSTTPGQGIAERAILAEAALQAVLTADADKVRSLGISRAMKHKYQRLEAAADLVGPRLLPVLLPTALQLSQDALVERSTESAIVPTGRPQSISISKRLKASSLDPFTQKLLEPTVVETDDEGFFDTLGSVLSAASKGVDVVSKGLSIISKFVPKSESSFQESPLDEHLQILAKRALLAEAALQSLQEASPEELEAEGLFSSIKSIVQKIGPKVVKFAPLVVRALPTVVKALVGETAIENGESLVLPRRPGGLRPKKSFLDSVVFNGVSDASHDVEIAA